MAQFKNLVRIDLDNGPLYLTENLYKHLQTITTLTLDTHLEFDASINNALDDAEWIDVTKFHHTDFNKGRIQGSIYYNPEDYNEQVVYCPKYRGGLFGLLSLADTAYVFFDNIKEVKKQP